MKILAIEHELKPVPPEEAEAVLKMEAFKVWELKQKDIIREIYFNENRCAVLVLECKTIAEAGDYLSRLPLVERNHIRFEIMELRPYTGFERLF